MSYIGLVNATFPNGPLTSAERFMLGVPRMLTIEVLSNIFLALTIRHIKQYNLYAHLFV